MKYAYCAVVIFTLFFLCNCGDSAQQKQSPLVRNGMLDLCNWDFKKDGPVELKGEWKFKWMEDNPEYISPEYNDLAWDTFPVPGKWKKKLNAEIGYGWLRVEIKLKAMQELGLYLWSSETACLIFANGAELIRSGEPGTSRESTIVKQTPVIKSLPSAERLVLAWKVANFHDSSGGGPVYAPQIGVYPKLVRNLWNKDFFNTLFLGIILIMGLYHILLWIGRREDKSSLLFALFCLDIFIRALATTNILQRVIPDVSIYSIKLKIEYVTTSLGWVFFISFLCKVFPKEYSNIVLRVFQVSGFVISLFILCTPVWIFTNILSYLLIILIIVCIWICFSIILALKNKQSEAGIVLTGFILLFVTVINDVIHAEFVIPTAYITQIGLVLFILCMSSVLSLRFARAYKTADHLSRHLQEEVEEQTRIIEKKNEEKTNYFINLAHETKTPLTLIANYLNKYMGRRGVDTDLTIIKNNVDKLKNNMVNFLDFEKLEKGQEFYNHELITDMSAAMLNSVKLFKELAGLKQIDIISDIKENITVEADPAAVDRVINNLLDNAIKYTPKGGRLHVKLEEEKGSLELSIRDNGIGIPDDQLEHIFKPYHQISHSKRNIQGIGMGLNIVKKIVNHLGGEIEVQSTVGKGSRFAIRLKKHEIQKGDMVSVSNPITEFIGTTMEISGESRETNNGEKKYTLLVVEDNPDMLAYLYDALGDEYNVYRAKDGRQALEKLDTTAGVHLIISDIMMDVMDGYEFYEELENDNRYDHIPVIFLTAKNTQQEKITALKKGVVDFVHKPFDIEELKAKINSIINLTISQFEKSKRELIKHILQTSKSRKKENDVSYDFDKKLKQYGISEKEKDIILLLVQGKQYKDVADELHITENTVKSHISRIYRKCGVQNKIELINIFRPTL